MPPALVLSTGTRAGIPRLMRTTIYIMLMDVVGITILQPVAPYVVRRYSGDALMVTMLTVIYAAAQFFAAPVLGKLGDRYGRRPVLLVSVFGSAIGYVIFGIGGALWVLLLSRLIAVTTGGNMSTASAYIRAVSAFIFLCASPDLIRPNFDRHVKLGVDKTADFWYNIIESAPKK